jgi:hypothetical protein
MALATSVGLSHGRWPVLLKQSTLDGVVAGTVRAVYRRWRRPHVSPGSTFRTSAGVIAVDKVEPATVTTITARHAREAGFASRAELLVELARHTEGQLYRISLHLAGPDPRSILRRRSGLSADDVSQLQQRLARLGARSSDGPWAMSILRLIASRPAVRASELAEVLGMTTTQFKPRVRQLKDLGLTESLDVGYRLSPRGRALLDQGSS